MEGWHEDGMGCDGFAEGDFLRFINEQGALIK